MNHLQTYFEKNARNGINKWMHYFEIYDFWFNKYRNKPVTILEIGVYQGGSLQMWRDYFGKEAKIFAIDINPSCKQFETENTKIFIGDQEDREFLKSLKQKIPRIDVLIDDGGHTMRQQITTFEVLFDHIDNNGIYLCEDTHTSYWANFGGGYKKASSFIEYSKNLVDQLNAWHSRDKKLRENEFTRSTNSIHFYDSIVVIHKKERTEPISKMTGKVIIPIENFPIPKSKKNKVKEFVSKLIRRIPSK